MTPDWARTWRWLALPLLIALVAHGLCVHGGFVGDDLLDIVEHPVVNGRAPLTDVLAYNFMGDPLDKGANTIRPLVTLMFAAEFHVFGTAPAGYHVMNLAWFAGAVVLVGVLLASVVRRRAACWGTCAFAAMAIHVDAVGMIAHRAEVCALVFALLALFAIRVGRPVTAVALYVAALLCKESAILTPAIAAWWLYALDGREVLRWRAQGRSLLGLCIAGAAFLIVRAQIVPLDIEGRILAVDNPLLAADLGARLWMPLVLLGTYLHLTIAPVELSFDYTYAAIPVDANLARAHGWLGLAAVIGLVLIVGIRVRRGERASPALRAQAAAAGGFAFAFALTSNSLVLIPTLFAERLFLVPSAFLVVLACTLTAAATPSVSRPGLRRLLGAVLVAWLVIQVGLAMERTKEIASRDGLLLSQVRTQPASVKGRLYLARLLARHGFLDEALWHLGVAALGKRAFPGPFHPPPIDDAPLSDRLAYLPSALSPGVPPSQFWHSFAAFASQLGPAARARANALAAGTPPS